MADRDSIIRAFGAIKEEDITDYFSVVENIEKVEDISPMVEGDPHRYRIYFEKEKVIELTSKEILTQLEFKRKYLEVFRKLVKFQKGEWDSFVSGVVGIAELIEDQAVTDEQYLTDFVLGRIRGLEGTEDPETATINSEYALVGQNGALYYYNEYIKDLLDKSKVKVPLARLHHILKPYLAGPSEVRKVGNRAVRFWKFDKKKSGYGEEEAKNI